MTKEELIQKWLDHDLTEGEMIAFKELEDYDSLMKVDRVAKRFKAPAYDSSSQYDKLLTKRSEKTTSKKLRPLWWSVAAALVISFSVYFLQLDPATQLYETASKEQEQVLLPDDSKVFLLANSKLSFQESSWSTARELSLEGQANFDVETGKTFTVNTSQGTIEVLGTNFTVKDFKGYFEVICYEGKVKVTYQDRHKLLTPRMIFRSIEGKISEPRLGERETVWSSQYEYFKSVPLSIVIEAIERNYGVTILNAANTKGVFTGKISYSELNTALQSISIPFGLTVETKENTIILKSR